MANRLYHIDTQASTALGVAQVLNTNGVNNARFRVRNLHLRFALNVTGGGAPTTIGAVDAGTTRIELLWRKTNRPFLNNIEARALDFYIQREHQPSVGCIGYNTLTPQNVAAGIATQCVFDFKIPIEKIQAADGADYAQMLDEIGQCTVQLPAALGGANPVALGTWTTTLFAEGEDYEGAYFAGAQTRVDGLASSAGNTYEALCYGNKLRQIYSYSNNTAAAPAGSPQTGETSPRVLFDGREVYNYRNLNGGDLPYYASNGWSQSGIYNQFYLPSAVGLPQQSIICAPYVQLDPTLSIIAMDTVNVAQLTWAARASILVAQQITFVVETIYPDGAGAALAQRIPGAAFMNAADISALVSRPGPTGDSSDAPIQDKAFLPAKVQM
tara:strand:+ start:179 stop:1330 length:1152 start_codon:yes stop_codon:yes gene_type:complete